jgi:hypothetical protein
MNITVAARSALAGIAFAVSPLAAQRPKKDSHVITREELALHPDFKNAYEAIRTLRPMFLRASRVTADMFRSTPASPAGAVSDDPSGGSVRSEGILVVVDNVRQGGVEALRTIETERILEIRHLSASEAYDLYGSDQAGVIVIKTGRADTKP